MQQIRESIFGSEGARNRKKPPKTAGSPEYETRVFGSSPEFIFRGEPGTRLWIHYEPPSARCCLAWSDGRGAQHGAGRVTSASGGAARCPASGRPEGPGCSVQPRPSPQAALRAGTSAASTRRDRPQSGRPCAFRERKPAHLRLKWASNPFGRRRFASCECCNLSFASCECCNLSEVRLGEGQLRAGRGTSSRQEWLRSRKGEGEVDAAVAEAGSLEGSALQNTFSAPFGAQRRVTPSVGERSRAYGSAAKTGS